MGRQSDKLLATLDNPFALGRRSAVDNTYHLMPTQLDPSLSLKVFNPLLFKQVEGFYKLVRNPIFHGSQLYGLAYALDPIRQAFEFLACIYEWIDDWYDPEMFFIGAGQFKHVRARYPRPHDDDAL